MTRYTICRSEASLFWNSLEIEKKSVVASLGGNLSPVKRRRAIFVKRTRHFRGETGVVLKRRANEANQLAFFHAFEQLSHPLGRPRSDRP